jgi:hypothetical protein
VDFLHQFFGGDVPKKDKLPPDPDSSDACRDKSVGGTFRGGCGMATHDPCTHNSLALIRSE